MNRVMIIAGEPSGDQYGAKLIPEIVRLCPNCAFTGIGGDGMRNTGMTLLHHIEETAVMGFVEVARHYPALRRIFRNCVEELRRNVDALVLIDYPGFNLRLARAAKSTGIPVIYYISPQVWAWGKNRVQKMKGLVDHLAVVFPFELELFSDAGIPTTFVGHPLLEILKHAERDAFLRAHGIADKRILALLPGSRKQEIQRTLPIMLEAVRRMRNQIDCEVIIGAASTQPDGIYRNIVGLERNVVILRNATHSLMEHAYAAIVTSGTATVETAFYETPLVIVYRSTALNHFIAKKIIRVPYIGMPNILSGERIIPELIQDELTAKNLAEELLPLFQSDERYRMAKEKLHRVRQAMGTPGASERVARIVASFLRK